MSKQFEVRKRVLHFWEQNDTSGRRLWLDILLMKDTADERFMTLSDLNFTTQDRIWKKT